VTGAIDRRIESSNLIYAIRITGHFAELHTRTVMEQKKPYTTLTQATEGQAETRFSDVTGVVVGFRTPDYHKASPSRDTTCTSSTATAQAGPCARFQPRARSGRGQWWRRSCI